MSLRAQLDADLKTAMKARDALRLSTIRSVKSAIQYKEVEGGTPTTLDDAGILKIIVGLVKQRKDSIEQFRTGGRDELADKEQKELEVLEVYLPRQLTEAEVEALVVETIAEVGATSPKDMGAVMKAIGPKTSGRADGRVVSSLVKSKLA